MNSKIISILLILSTISFISSFTPSSETLFYEDFQSGSGKWVASKVAKYEGSTILFNAGLEPVNESDIGLVLALPAKHYSITSKLNKPIDNTGKELVVQYEVQLQEGLDCGGAYVKLYTYSSSLDPEQVDNDTPYSIMFGPDKCGTENRIHFIVRHKNPITGLYEEKLLHGKPSIRTDKLSHTYTLYIRTDNSFTIYIDQEVVLDGKFHEDFTPSFNPPKEIDDPEDKKPEDWVDEAKIPEPGASKPEDWDESQPARIQDPSASKPEDWLDNEPEIIPSGEGKPEEWNDEDDGEWEATMIPNPKCEDGNCGEWKAPMIANPLYKGIWSAPMIDNPAYKGEWKPRKINNPNYYTVEQPYIVDRIGSVGIEVWTMSKNVKFDNFIITHSRDESIQFAKENFSPKNKLEKERQSKQEAEEAAKLNQEGSLVDKLKSYFNLYLQELQKLNPLVVAITTISVIVLPLLLLRGGKKSATKKDDVVIESSTDKKESDTSSEEDESSDDEKEPKSPSTKKRSMKVK